jgi:hypothetical protein
MQARESMAAKVEVPPNRRTRVEPLKKDSTNEKPTSEPGNAPQLR